MSSQSAVSIAKSRWSIDSVQIWIGFVDIGEQEKELINKMAAGMFK
jgi:hypothetical protein